MATHKNPNSNLYNLGVILLAISLIVYWLPAWTPFNTDAYFGLFAVNYLIVISYFILLLVQKKHRKGSGGLSLVFVLLVLFHLSAWSLNKSLPVFEKSTTGLTVILIISNIGCMMVHFYERLPKWGKYGVMFTLGIGFTVFAYLSIYLLSLYPISILLAIGFGFSLHSFVPLLFVLFIIIQCYRFWKTDKRSIVYSAAGAILPVLIGMGFTIAWNNLNKKVSAAFQQTLIDDNTDLPGWVRVAQTIPLNSMTEKYLKSDLVYTLPSQTWDWSLPTRDYEEVRQHDPLIMFAAAFSKPPALSQEERIKILESVYDARHKTLNRLWSGNHLVTQSVLSNVRIWPESRIAYTEKTITVFCDEPAKEWQNQREAIYTFYLPEGGVVTSLSLWINGKEEKARLTTQSKADSAYKTIVGVESRDPSVVHWQEGNTVSVRVFPVLTGQNRVFKIGVTAPLKLTDGQLVYENLYFRGPDVTNATEIRQVDWVNMPGGFAMPEGYTANGNSRYIKKSGAYEQGWQLSFKDPGIRQGTFSFDQHSYTIEPARIVLQDASFSRVYLDINELWSEQDIRDAINAIKGQSSLYVYSDRTDQLNGDYEKDKELLNTLRKRHFSIFPFYAIEDKEHSLVVTKGTSSSPNLSDLKNSEFGDRLENSIRAGGRYNVFCMSAQESPYLKALKEHRVFNYAHGEVALLERYVNEKKYPENIENDSTAVVESAGVQLVQTANKGVSDAPDHLMRLYAYNSIMRKLGTGIFTNQETDTALVSQAEQAYIVTPVSSLVVLETQTDYDRFGISESKNSLQNATLKSGGAVPEPEEWALIIIACAALLWTVYRKKSKEQYRHE